jgi:methionine-rich copper-binding protein CopC
LRKLLLIPVLAALAALGSISLINAHSRPVLFDPPAGAILDSSPEQVQVWFTAELRRDPNWNFLQVANAAGERVDTGETELAEDRPSMTATLQPDLPEGRYVVTWRSFDDGDNAIFGDCYVFFVGQAAADQSVEEGLRLDGGRDCQRIDVSAEGGTPVAGGTPPADATETGHSSTGSTGGGEASAGESSDDDSDGVPAWTLALGIIGGIVAGGAGMKFLGSRG